MMRIGPMFGGRVRGWLRPQFLQVVAIVFVMGVLMIGINVYQLRVLQTSHMALHRERGSFASVEVGGSLDQWNSLDPPRPKFWLAANNLESGYLDHVLAVFSRIGHQQTNGGQQGPGGQPWDTLWSHDYPFQKLSSHLSKLKPHQKVNHFPGSGFITNKLNLATSDIKHIPKAFKIPKHKDEFLNYSQLNPTQLWVQKSNTHRGVTIKALADLDLTSENTFIQEYVDKPYLIDGYRFDIGIYTVLTSIDPLRIYTFNDDWLIRFCPVEYYPFDPAVLDKYVVTDDYLAPWDVPAMARFYTGQDTTRKQALMSVLQEEGQNGQKLENDIFETIVSVYLNKEIKLIHSSKGYPSSRHFFEMVRFDFVFDDKLNVYLMEVNMSPNLSSGHFPANKLMYEQVVFGLLNLVGLASSTSQDIVRSNVDEVNMQVSSKDVHVYTEQCASNLCKDKCGPMVCKLCKLCLKGDDAVTLKTAHMEHINRHGFQRVFPRAFQSQVEAKKWNFTSDNNFSSLNPVNQWMTLWFRGKCIQDLRWCA